MLIIFRETQLKILLLNLMLVLFVPTSAVAESRAEQCVDMGPTQYFDAMSTCVTSVLASQGSNRYGPEQLSDESGAWCEGSTGDGLKEEIRFYFLNSAAPMFFYIRNGYVKSSNAFGQNGRVAAFKLSDDAGNAKVIYLEDTPDEQLIYVPWDREDIVWIQFEIREVFRGSKYRDTCISQLGPDFEGG